MLCRIFEFMHTSANQHELLVVPKYLIHINLSDHELKVIWTNNRIEYIYIYINIY